MSFAWFAGLQKVMFPCPAIWMQCNAEFQQQLDLSDLLGKIHCFVKWKSRAYLADVCIADSFVFCYNQDMAR